MDKECKYCHRKRESHANAQKYIKAWCPYPDNISTYYTPLSNLEYLEKKYNEKT